MAEHLHAVAYEPPLGPRLGAIHPAELGLRLTGVAGVAREMNAHPQSVGSRKRRNGDVRRIPDVEECEMSYFVTGATGFIGRNLVELLLEREGTIYVLVREGSREGSRSCATAGARTRTGSSAWSATSPSPASGLRGPDLGLKGKIDHFFHLAAIYDMTADAESQRVANVEGTRHMVELAEAVEARRVHMVSSIAAAGLYKGTWREDMFEEAENLDTHPYFRTKHESEAVVR